MTRRVQTRWVIGAACVMASMIGCGDAFGPPDDKVTVINATQDTVAFSISELQTSYLVDPNQFPSRASFNGRILAPGRSQRVAVSDIAGYRRKADLVIFAWSVRGDSIRFPWSVTWTHAEQLKSAYRIGIEYRLTIQE